MVTILRNAHVLDINHESDGAFYSIVIEDGVIKKVSTEPVEDSNVTEDIDLAGRTVMPGMIDCHVHVVASTADLLINSELPNTLAVLRAVPILKSMLNRGFTTIRDAGGADYALSTAVSEGLIEGPRMYIAGKALSQTGGHGDFRQRFDYRSTDTDPCACHRRAGSLGLVVDGVDDVRRAVRELIRTGSSQIKIMASGGVASPVDPIGNLQFSVDEIKAIVEEATSHQTYVMAHAYTAQAVSRVAELGIRTVEHANLIDEATAKLLAEKGTFVVPTLVTYDAMAREGASAGLSRSTLEKNEIVRKKGLEALAMLKKYKVKVGLGSDLLGDLHKYQSDELSIRAEVVGAFEAICQATAIGAEIIGMKGQLGVVSEGAFADLLIVNGNPADDIKLLGGQGEHLHGVMKGGSWVRYGTN